MKKILAPKLRSRLRPLLTVAALFALNTVPAFAQSTTFSSTDLRTGISNSLAVIMMFGFVLGISSVIYGGFAIRRGDVDQGKMSIIGGAIIAAAPGRGLCLLQNLRPRCEQRGWRRQFLTHKTNSAQPAYERQKRTSPDRHQRCVRFQRPHLGFGRWSFLVAHRRHRRGHHRFFCPARRPELVAPLFHSSSRSCRCRFALPTSSSCGRASRPATTATFLNMPRPDAASARRPDTTSNHPLL